MCDVAYSIDARAQGFGIPARKYALAVLAHLYDSSSICKNAAVSCPVTHDGLKRKFPNIPWFLHEKFLC